MPKRKLEKVVESTPLLKTDFTCQTKAPGQIVVFSVATNRPHLSDAKSLWPDKSLRSETPDNLSMIEPNQTNVKALLQQQKASRAAASP